ncbi:MAG: hypothetical protein PUC41_00695 [Oscillospiraceae bacterium]|nr:hypothetical protein [Oscillospiraceae bacterium]
MKSLKKTMQSVAATLAIGSALVAAPMTAHAYSINDVAQALRNACVPESQIQQMLNVYQYCEKDENGIYYGDYYYRYDEIVWTIEGFGDSINGVIDQYMESAIAMQQQIMASATATTTTTTGTGTGNGSSTTTTTVKPQKSFELMTMDEKIAYLASLPEDTRKEFMANLSIDEKQSILAQMSTDNQAAVLDQMTQILKELGFHMSVDNMQQGQIDVSVRDENGNLIDSSPMGVIVEDTGWNLTGWFALASVLVLIAVGGIGFMIYRSGKETEEDNNV